LTNFNGYEFGTNIGSEFEVGWAYEGTPTSDEKKKAIQLMLDLYGDQLDDWRMAPKILIEPAIVSVSDFGRGPLKATGDSWAIYGVTSKKPSVGELVEGVRMPLFKDIDLGV
jgi:hypothetical protein